MTEKQIETVAVPYEQFSDYDFIAPCSFFIRIASGEYIFYKTSSRVKAQAQIDVDFPPKGKYTAIPVKTTKTKPRTESGQFTCTGTASRRK